MNIEMNKKMRIFKEHFFAITELDRDKVNMIIDLDVYDNVIESIFVTFKISQSSDADISTITRDMKGYQIKIDRYFQEYRINEDIKPYRGNFNIPPSIVFKVNYDGIEELLDLEIQYDIYTNNN